MATWYPHAVRRPIPRHFGGKRRRTRGAVLHVDAGGASSLFGWFSNPASGASSHFHVKYDGIVEQYVDADLIAWTQRAGNTTCIGIETQGKGDGEWTLAQLAAIVALLRWLSEVYKIPLTDMLTSRPGSTGIGMHRYGIDPYRAAGGEIWGPRGKACPGNDRVRQFPALVASLGGAPVSGGGSAPAPAPESEVAKIARMNAGYSQAWIKAVQNKLNRLGYNAGDEDGVRGAKTISAVRAFQRAKGLVDDGLPGSLTNDKLDQALAGVASPTYDIAALQGAVRAVKDRIWGNDTDKRFDALREATEYHRAARGLPAIRFPWGVKYTQGVVGTPQDGAWGGNSRRAHDATVKAVQAALLRPQTGVWDKATETAYLAARRQGGRG